MNNEHIGVYSFTGKFQPQEVKWGEISFTWRAGRHEVDLDKITIHSEMKVHINIDEAIDTPKQKP